MAWGQEKDLDEYETFFRATECSADGSQHTSHPPDLLEEWLQPLESGSVHSERDLDELRAEAEGVHIFDLKRDRASEAAAALRRDGFVALAALGPTVLRRARRLSAALLRRVVRDGTAWGGQPWSQAPWNWPLARQFAKSWSPFGAPSPSVCSALGVMLRFLAPSNRIFMRMFRSRRSVWTSADVANVVHKKLSLRRPGEEKERGCCQCSDSRAQGNLSGTERPGTRSDV
eukprot:g17536.t1